MTTFFRTIIIILVVATPLSFWAIGFHLARIPSSVQDAARRRDEEVERLEQALKRREAARHEAVQELLCQHSTLTQTLQRFQELNQEWPDLSALARVAGAKESDEKIAYRLIIWYVQMTLAGQAEELAAVLPLLEKEYQQSQDGRKKVENSAAEESGRKDSRFSPSGEGNPRTSGRTQEVPCRAG